MYTVQNKNDIRYKTTHDNIRKVYKELLSQKNYLQISVTEICKLANINRGTFYIHYEDSQAVMIEFENEIYQQIVCFIDDAMKMNQPHHELSTTVSNYLKTEDGDFLDKVLNGIYGSGSLYLKICDYISSSISPVFINGGKLTKREAELLSIFLANGAAAVFHDWNKHGYKNLIKEYKFSSNLVDSIMELYGIAFS